MAGFDDLMGDLDGAGAKDPMKVAAQSMKKKFPKRFYKEVDIRFDTEQDHWHILLDSRVVKTPGRNALALPSKAAARLVASEWANVEDRIDPTFMPCTRLANTAIDGVATDPQAVKEDILRFSGSDLLCYRAEGPQGLLEIQRAQWDPVIDWAQAALGARFLLAEGVMHIEQPAEAIAAFSAHVGMVECPVTLTALHSLTTLTGSALLAMAMLKWEISADEAWSAALVDEDWQISQWGEDDEALAMRAARRVEMDAAAAMIDALASE